jgi:methionyl-tRNA formyltransferase
MGTPALAALVLDRLVQTSGEDFAVVGVVTRPDRPRNRGLQLEPSEVGAVAAHHGLTTLKPTKIRTSEFLAELQAFAPDLLVVVAYGRILPNPVLDAARIMPINLHASLLPRHRGAAPIEGAILAGDRISGVTIMRITEQMDAGPILFKRELELAFDETQGSLKQRMAELGATALIEALALARHGELVETPQDESLATYTTPVKKDDARIDWRREAVKIERMVRAYDPWPVVRTALGGADLMVWKARVAANPVAAPRLDDQAAGTVVVTKETLAVQCGDRLLELVEVQAAGRRRLAGIEFARGRRLITGMQLGS